MSPEQWTAIGAVIPGLIVAATALITACISYLNRRTLVRVESKVDGNLARLADHLEQARLELVALEQRRNREVTAGQRRLNRSRRRKPAADAGRERGERASDR